MNVNNIFKTIILIVIYYFVIKLVVVFKVCSEDLLVD